MEERDYFAWLSTVENMQYTKLRRFLKAGNTAKELYMASDKKLESIKEMTQRDIEEIKRAKNTFELDAFYKKLEQKEIKFVTICDDAFPKKLKCLEHGPYYLFYKGQLPDENKKSVAMVGARACSNYGRGMSKKFAKELSDAGVQIISGMARGIDTYSQLGALEGKTKTFAVLGCGVDLVYPTENIELYENIVENGGIISEYPPGSPPLSWHFPQRNRIISGLSDIVAVIEAKEKSGSLITVEWALEQGKDIYALPGRANDVLSSGCNRLIKAGAGVITSAKDMINELYPGECFDEKKRDFQEKLLEKEFSLVYIELSLEPVSMEELMNKTGMQYEQISEILLQLQLIGLVEQPMDNYYAKKVM